jgi:hypothetical protein
MSIISFILIAMFIEAIISIFKPIWDKKATPITIPEYISMALGVFIAVIAKLNLLDGLVTINNIILLYLFYVMSGIALGRGPSFIYDLWQKFKTTSGTDTK